MKYYATQLYKDDFINQCKDPFFPTSLKESRRDFSKGEQKNQ